MMIGTWQLIESGRRTSERSWNASALLRWAALFRIKKTKRTLRRKTPSHQEENPRWLDTAAFHRLHCPVHNAIGTCLFVCYFDHPSKLFTQGVLPPRWMSQTTWVLSGSALFS